jgi:hypothetical protein
MGFSVDSWNTERTDRAGLSAELASASRTGRPRAPAIWRSWNLSRTRAAALPGGDQLSIRVTTNARQMDGADCTRRTSRST